MGQFAPAISIISGIYGVYSGVQQSKEASKAASKQEKLARQNAANIEAETREEARRVQLAGDKALASGRAKAAASGVDTAGSMDVWLGNEEDELNKELDWLTTSGSNKASLAVQAGSNAADITRQQGQNAAASSIVGGFGQAASSSWFN